MDTSCQQAPVGLDTGGGAAGGEMTNSRVTARRMAGTPNRLDTTVDNGGGGGGEKTEVTIVQDVLSPTTLTVPMIRLSSEALIARSE